MSAKKENEMLSATSTRKTHCHVPHGQEDDERHGGGAPQEHQRHQQLGVHLIDMTGCKRTCE